MHVDIKKQGRIPDGGGHHMNGRATGRKHKGHRGGLGYSFWHRALGRLTPVEFEAIMTTQATAAA